MQEKLMQTVNALKKRGFDAHAARTAEEACALALSLIDKKESITWGGSMTAAEIGLFDKLKAEGYNTFDRADVPAAERMNFYREHFFSDWYLMGSNAVTEEGELLNLDAIGNRVASLVFGPRRVIVLAGRNKIVPNLASARRRVREVAAPRNAQRFDIATPCKKTGACADCFSPDTICCSMVETRFCRPAGRITVILIDGDFGF